MTKPPAIVPVVGAMLSVQLGAALTTSLFDRIGAAGAGSLRLALAALIFLAIMRPRVRAMGRRTVLAAALLGVVTAATTLSYLAAIDRIPLGTASAIEFLGPLGVAVARSAERRKLIWPLLAAVGVAALTEPWAGSVDPIGLGWAALAALGWGSYVVLTQRVGDQAGGLQGLAVSIPVAAASAAVVGGPAVVGELSVMLLLQGLGLALLLPVIPFALEMIALRRLTVTAFGTLMSLEPAIALGIGALLLNQIPAPWQLAGMLLVVVAGIGAARTGHRVPEPAPAREL